MILRKSGNKDALDTFARLDGVKYFCPIRQMNTHGSQTGEIPVGRSHQMQHPDPGDGAGAIAHFQSVTLMDGGSPLHRDRLGTGNGDDTDPAEYPRHINGGYSQRKLLRCIPS